MEESNSLNGDVIAREAKAAVKEMGSKPISNYGQRVAGRHSEDVVPLPEKHCTLSRLERRWAVNAVSTIKNVIGKTWNTHIAEFWQPSNHKESLEDAAKLELAQGI